ncbi:MAG: Jag N-terminal domain-containing protein [Proteobacteria bacterium]|nr:Jag N-terminal domain-containing protein [Pseudomonadota bacterium]MBU1139316.1 Jag N-terminal domain-containing protein [Pseudomonadota bacterium]
MSSGKKKDFYGKEVTDAIKEACNSLRVPQEELEIEVVEVGSMGVFGLIRKKAHIRAMVKVAAEEMDNEVPVVDTPVVPEPVAEVVVEEVSPEPIPEGEKEVEQEETSKVEEPKGKQRAAQNAPIAIQAESVEIVRQELSELLRLMSFPSEVTAELDGSTVRCHVNGDYEEALTGQDGKIIDSLQYILRKLITRKIEEKVRVSIDIGEFREKRKEELMARAKELAGLVKEDGKTQAIPPLNPSERRIVHVALQDDKEIRSRSVGDGLFKKILIYKPGKGKKPGNSKRSGGKGQRGRGNKPEEDVES